jgi:hypothetical protein|tara:strand:+ start:5000 stop:5260 length:261 start_codon:yes stop_codon:yes gene_type:complete
MNLTDQEIEEVVVTELKSYYNVLARTVDDGKWSRENEVVDEGWYRNVKDRNEDRKTLSSIIDVLSHYITKEDHDKWLIAIRQVTQK